ncbi:VWFA domain-containing protein [Tumidithrix helvetica PCC 7403]|uniref:vWA domain-containing protein n=1 Tax=Tumidithrix helvetica TaxID=3457545 RepID=UPI003CC01024
MNVPSIQFVPLREVVCTDASITLDLLIKIVPPAIQIEKNRPQLNISLVVDRSGSMHGQKIEFAKKAACFAVEQLTPSDRVSIVIYDDKIEAIVPSTLATDKSEMVRNIQRIQSGGSTALHEGWRQGGIQVSQHLNPTHLNRVILLSDGQANLGETNPDVIATDTHKLSKLGVSTTTMGIGDDYNEDLMEAMAKSGNGNYYFIEFAEQLPNIFQTELQGLMATIGSKVSLTLVPKNGVEVLDVFNDFDRNSTGSYQLPNLIFGNPIMVALRLKVPEVSTNTQLCEFTLRWNSPELAQRQKLETTLQLSAVKKSQLDDFPFNKEVQREVAKLMAARAKDEVVRNIDRGDIAAAKQVIDKTIGECAAYEFGGMEAEMKALKELESDLDDNTILRARKRAKFQGHTTRNSQNF